MIKRCLGAAAVAAVLMALLVPVTASASHLNGHAAPVFVAPTPGDNQAISGNHTVKVSFSSALGSGNLKSISVTIYPVSPASIPPLGPAATISETFAFVGAPSTRELTLPWNTAALTPRNGTYRIEALVEWHNGFTDPPLSGSRNGIKVDNAPAPPSAASAAFVSDDEYFQAGDLVNVGWSTSPRSADHMGYRVYRSVDDASFAMVDETTGNSYADGDIAPESKYEYRVAAFRYSPVGGTIASGQISTEAVNTPKVPPPPTPPPSPSPSASAGTGTKTTDGRPPGLTLTSDEKKGAPASAPLQSIKPPVIRTGAGRAGGFSKLLPFSESIPKVLAEGTPGNSGSVTSALSAPGRLVGEQLRVNPARFLAAGALLLVVAGHLANMARGLLLVPSIQGSQGPISSI